MKRRSEEGSRSAKSKCAMYKIEKGRHGFTLTFSGTIYTDELERWFQESEKALARHKGPFGVIIDMRDLLPLGPEARAVILRGQRLFKDSGLERSVVVLKSSAITSQFRQLAKDSGVYRFERYINASDDSQWFQHALDWVLLQIDPDESLSFTSSVRHSPLNPAKY
jgi:hypothetical protein